jgi:hypothetical protein
LRGDDDAPKTRALARNALRTWNFEPASASSAPISANRSMRETMRMWVDSLGWLAAGLTFLAFSMRGMLALRIAGIAANIAFIGYGMAEQLYPVVGLHLMLLPCNTVRLVELWRKRGLSCLAA